MLSAMVPGVVGFAGAMSGCVGSKRVCPKHCVGGANLGDPKLKQSSAVLVVLVSSKTVG